MNNFTKFEKYAIINILSRIMKADGVIDPKEEDFMNHIYSSFAITISELENISSIDYCPQDDGRKESPSYDTIFRNG